MYQPSSPGFPFVKSSGNGRGTSFHMRLKKMSRKTFQNQLMKTFCKMPQLFDLNKLKAV